MKKAAYRNDHKGIHWSSSKISRLLSWHPRFHEGSRLALRLTVLSFFSALASSSRWNPLKAGAFPAAAPGDGAAAPLLPLMVPQGTRLRAKYSLRAKNNSSWTSESLLPPGCCGRAVGQRFFFVRRTSGSPFFCRSLLSYLPRRRNERRVTLSVFPYDWGIKLFSH